MKRISFFLFLFSAAGVSVAQSVSPDVVASAGNSFINSTFQLDWTLGECATSTLNNSTNILTQGFHQNNLIITALGNFDTKNEFVIFPNPTADMIQIQALKTPNENYSMELYTADGKLLSTQSSDFNTSAQIDMCNYDNGMYVLKIKSKNTNMKSYQIIKFK